MELKKVIVILYGKEKHDVIAAGVKAHLQEYSRDYDVVMVSDEQYTPDYNAVIKRKFYTFCQRNANWLYVLYSKSSENKALRAYAKQRKKNAETVLPTEKLKRQVSYVKNVIFRFEPEAVVCMTPDSLKLALTVREINNIKTRVVAYMPDFGVDLRFLDKRCDKYFMANDYAKKQLIKKGIGEEKIMVTGITYASNLKENFSKAECRKELNLNNDNPLVVLSGGKYGCLKIADDFNKIIGSICQFNLVALTGGNKKLGALMKAFKANENTKNIIITDEVDMKKLLCSADIVITTPSTGDVLNAMINNCAVITINPLSMVEKSNYEFFKKTGIVRTAKSAHITSVMLTELLLEDKERNKLLDMENQYLKPLEKKQTHEIMMLMEAKNDKTHSYVQAEGSDGGEQGSAES